jgi:undecaprenyl-diphosphatase
MMSAPAIVGSLLMEGKDAVEMGYIHDIALLPTIVGVLVAGLVGYLAIRFMLRIITKVPLVWFSIYLAIIGIVYLLLQLSGSTLLPAFAPAVG